MQARAANELSGINDDGTTDGSPAMSRTDAAPVLGMWDVHVPLDLLVLYKFSDKFRRVISSKKNTRGRVPRVTHIDGRRENCALSNLLFDNVVDSSRAADAHALKHVLAQEWLYGEAGHPCPGPWVWHMAGAA